MNRSHLTSLFAALSLSFAGCSSASDKPNAESKEQTEKVLIEFASLREVLATITDEASANAAVPKIKEIAATLKALKDNPGDDKTVKGFAEQIKTPKMTENATKISREISRISKIPGAETATKEATDALQLVGGR